MLASSAFLCAKDHFASEVVLNGNMLESITLELAVFGLAVYNGRRNLLESAIEKFHCLKLGEDL